MHSSSPSTSLKIGFPMRMLIWNLRGFGGRGRRSQLKDYLRRLKIDIVFLQETIRDSFSIQELDGLVRDKFFWEWVPASGRSGGMLVGLRDSAFEVGAVGEGEFVLDRKSVV